MRSLALIVVLALCLSVPVATATQEPCRDDNCPPSVGDLLIANVDDCWNTHPLLPVLN